MAICNCSVNYGKQCFFPEDYNSSGCTAEEEGWFPIIDYYNDPEYSESMGKLEDHIYWVLAEDVGCNFSFSLGQDLSLEKAESIKATCEDEGSGIRITVMRQ